MLNWLALIILVIATIYNAYWAWGLLFIYWAVQGLWTPVTTLIAPVARSENAVLFWTINLMWLIFGLWYFLYDLLWRFEITPYSA